MLLRQSTDHKLTLSCSKTEAQPQGVMVITATVKNTWI